MRQVSRRTYDGPPTIGYLTSGIGDDISRAIWQGVIETTEKRGAGLFTFVGGFLRDAEGFAAQSNIAYSLATAPKLEGLITWASSIGGLVSQDDINAFHRHYQPLPTVSIALPLPDIPALMLDGYQGMRELLVHLIEAHGYHRLAFIRGPETHYYAQERYRAYVDVLADYSIPFDPRLVSPSLAWSRNAGRQAVQLLFEERALRAGSDVQALVAASDWQAHGAWSALQAYGLRVPEDVALVGVNDNRESRVSTPPLTSVALPYRELGQLAVETLLTLLDGGQVNAFTTLDARLTLRQSCGCADADLEGAAVPPAPPVNRLSRPALADERAAIALSMTEAMPGAARSRIDQRADDLLDAFLADLDGKPGYFLATLDAALNQVDTSSHVLAWHRVISAMRRGIVVHETGDNRRRAENLWHQARVMIGKRARRLEAIRRLHLEQQAELLRDLGSRLTAATDIKQLMDILAEGLPRLDIPSGYVMLYEQPHPYQYPLAAPEYSRLMLAFDAKGRIGLEPDGHRFRTHDLAPPHILPIERHRYVVEPLYFQEHQLGFVLLELGPTDGVLYEAVRTQLSAAIRGVQLLERNASLYQQAVEAQQAALEGQRLAEEADLFKSRFLSMVSHELLTPLVLLVGLSEMMLREWTGGRLPLPEPYQQDLRRIHVSARQLGSLVRDVLDLARSHVGQLKIARQPVDLKEVLAAVAQVGEQMAREMSLAWHVELPTTLPEVLGDAARLRQVVLNLVANAVKFTAEGQVTLRVQYDANAVTVLVSDTGLGVPVVEQAAIFDEFRQSERTTARGYGGLGIGLAICRQIVEMHGGEMGVRSSGEENGGSTFYFTLPITSAKAEVAEHQLLPSQRVLVLTERTREGTRLTEYLQRQGYEVEALGIRDRADWLSLVLASPPGALILDAPATKLGWDLIRPLRENPATQDIPLLFYSLYQEADSGSMLALDYLTKPIEIDTLADTLRRYGLRDTDARAPSILVVDDNDGIRELHRQLIQTLLPECRVLEAANGRVALSVMQHTRPSLILLDLMMPELDGFGVLEAMQAQEGLRGIPVIVLTAQVLTQIDMARLSQGVTAVLSKGLFTTEETFERIEQALARHKRLRSETQQLVRHVMAYIHEHYAHPLTRDELADYAGVSPRHLTRAFDEEVGISAMTYLNRYRILEAKRLLEQGDKNITEIATAVGFSNSSYFGTVFRREVGLAPRDYQREHE